MLAPSVIVCTHNPRPDYFALCLDALRHQTLPPDQWELLVVDNCSEDPLGERLDLSWHPFARLVQEDRLGLTSARIRGIRESKGPLVVFVDDDNVVDSDFLETTICIARDKPFLGAWSGQCRPKFEKPPPEWTRRYWGNLVIREFDSDVWSNLPRLAQSLPCGAGLCVRREVAAHYVRLHDSGRRSFQFDRAGKSLLSGGDNDLAACACDIGLGIGLVSALKLTHLIPPARLTEDYLVQLTEGITFSGAMLDSERGISVVPRGTIGRVADLLRIWRERPPHRRILRASFRGRERAARLLCSSN